MRYRTPSAPRLHQYISGHQIKRFSIKYSKKNIVGCQTDKVTSVRWIKRSKEGSESDRFEINVGARGFHGGN